MLISFDKIKHKKGQGIVEYAMLLAFVVGIAMMLNNTNIGSAVIDTFDRVVSVLKGEEQNAYFAGLAKWGKATEFKPETQEERLAIDQLALQNLASFFLNKDKSYIKSLMKNGADGTSNSGILLGHFGYDGSNSFFTSEDSQDQLKATETNNLLHWMQGDYGSYDSEHQKVDGYKDLTYDTSYRYLVSDYPVQYPYKGLDGNGPVTGDGARGGVKVKLKYDKDNKVVAAKIAIDQKSQGATVGNLQNASKGLEVTVRNDGTKSITQGFNNTF